MAFFLWLRFLWLRLERDYHLIVAGYSYLVLIAGEGGESIVFAELNSVIPDQRIGHWW